MIDNTHFCHELGLSKDCLPAKVYEGVSSNQQTIRYFMDKFPLFIAPPFRGVPPRGHLQLCGFWLREDVQLRFPS